MPEQPNASSPLARTLVLDELFDLSLYQALRPHAGAETGKLLDMLVPIESKHLALWKEFFGVHERVSLDLGRRAKLAALALFCRVFGEPGIGITLEAIELRGIKKYLKVWEIYKNTPLGVQVRAILEEEFEHENAIITDRIARKVHPEQVRDLFLGFNDGLVEMLGAISGFFAALVSTEAVLAASFTVTIAGALSMAAGAYSGASSAQEIEGIEAGKRCFLGKNTTDEMADAHPLASGLTVGISYFFGALIPIIPVFFGARNLGLSIIVSLIVIIAISSILAFLSGMDARRRIGSNVITIAIAVVVTYAIGTLAHHYFGI